MPATPLTIDLWSDIVCPWCWIGKRRLERVLERTELSHRVQWRFHAFELGPRQQSPQPILEHLAQKYQVTLAEARAMTARVASLGAELGLTMNMDRCQSAATFDAHRLVQWAQTLGKAPALVEILHQAHFRDGLDVSDHGILRSLASQAGLDAAEAQRVLSTEAYGAEVEADLRKASSLEITGVPYTLVQGKWPVEGAQSLDVFEKALLEAAGD